MNFNFSPSFYKVVSDIANTDFFKCWKVELTDFFKNLHVYE